MRSIIPGDQKQHTRLPVNVHRCSLAVWGLLIHHLLFFMSFHASCKFRKNASWRGWLRTAQISFLMIPEVKLLAGRQSLWNSQARVLPLHIPTSGGIFDCWRCNSVSVSTFLSVLFTVSLLSKSVSWFHFSARPPVPTGLGGLMISFSSNCKDPVSKGIIF